MRGGLSCLLLVWFVLSGSAQYQFVKQWDYRYGGTGGETLLGFEQTVDGGYILGGWSQSGAGGDKTEDSWDTQPAYSDYWVVKIDSLGEKQWDKRYGGSGVDVLYKVIETKDGGYILSGHTGTGLNGDKTQPLWGGARPVAC